MSRADTGQYDLRAGWQMRSIKDWLRLAYGAYRARHPEVMAQVGLVINLSGPGGR